MIIFLPTIGSTASSLLPLIRQTLQLGPDYSDSFLHDLFTINLPGHFDNDRRFTENDLIEMIEQKCEYISLKQKKLARKLLLSHQSSLVKILKDNKVTLVGHGFGGVWAQLFALKRLNTIAHVVLLSCGATFDSRKLFNIKIRDFFLFRHSFSSLTSKISQEPNVYKKNILSLFAQNPRRLGYKSAFKIMQQFSFGRRFSRLSLAQQIYFMRIPMLCLMGNTDPYIVPENIVDLKNILNPRQPLFQATHVLSKLSQSNLSIEFLRENGHFFFEQEREQTAEIMRAFFAKGQ